MRGATPALITALAAAAQADIAELQSELPKCSIKCIADGAAKFDCGITDFACMCGMMEDMTREVSPCLVKAGCSFRQLTDVASIVADICKESAQTSSGFSADSNDRQPSKTSTETSKPTETPAGASALQRASFVGAVMVAAAAAVL